MKQNQTKIVEKSKDKEIHINRPKLDKKRLSDVLYQLNITRKNFLIYPPGHVQTNQSIKKCHALLHDLLELAPKLTIGVAKDKLFVDNTVIENKGHNIKDFALSAKNHELAGITFYRNISGDDLSCFFQLMAKDPEEIGDLGGFDKALAHNRIQTIKVQFIDFRAFHHIEEKEINRTKNQESQTKGSAIWTEFISGLLSGSLTASDQGVPIEQTKGINPSQVALFLNENKIDTKTASDQGVPIEQTKGINPSQLALFLNENKIDTKTASDQGVPIEQTKGINPSQLALFLNENKIDTKTASDQGVSIEQIKGINPSQLALFLNENKIDTKVALDTYRSTISKHMEEAGESITSPSICTNDFCELDLLLKNLNPKLKKQFLSATYNQFNSAGENEATKNLLTDFSEQVVLDMLRQANEDGEEISPSLMNLVYRITHAHGGMSHPEGETNFNESTNPLNLLSDTGTLQDIFTREKFEEYVTTDYENTLNNLSSDLDDEVVEVNKALPIEDFQKDLEPSHLDSQIAHIILAFMNDEINPVEYENYTIKLVEIAYDLLRTGGFPTLLKIVRALFKDYKDKSNPEIQSLAKNTLKKFREARFISLAIVSFEKWAKPDDNAAYEFLLSLGSIVVSEMIALYGKGERPEIQSLILKLLNKFPEETCLEAKRRFSDPQPSFVINMLTLVRKLGTEKDVSIVKRLLEHHDADVRISALVTIIELGDPEGPDVIRNFLRSFHTKEKYKVIEMIGTYKMADMVPDLISAIPRWTLFKFQYEKNETIITALGKIGNPSQCSIGMSNDIRFKKPRTNRKGHIKY
ncbi:MAG: hypothetical protein SRB1_01172 [Desulfobacteraceae bacterium Eth-SRB1]|nr:MAG: hypothetical protein SRB1_01172 [Desulfobacteraceae bacterium Eth-SRB1]